MALRINSNISSLNAQRNLGSSNVQLSKTLERLSSGLRINRAADDAAGLAVSEKLRTQIKGFSQATSNAQDAINLIATAESGLDQSSQILQRMRELSIQAGNDTLVNADRAKIQEEINQLRVELTRIAETTEFNTRKLLDGSIAQATGKANPTGEIKQNLRVGNTLATVPQMQDFFSTITLPTAGAGPGIPATFDLELEDNNRVAVVTQYNVTGLPGGQWYAPATLDMAFEFKLVSYQANSSAPVSVAIEVYNSVNGFLYSVDTSDPASFLEPNAGLGTARGGWEAGISGGRIPAGQSVLFLSLRPPVDGLYTTGEAVGIVQINNPTTLDIGKSAVIQITPPRTVVTTDSSLTFHVGANEGQFLKMGVQDMRGKALRMETLNILGSTDQDSRLKAQNAMGAIDSALEYVNTNRARLGAFQNRLEYTIQNLQISQENLTASESRIRDADIAMETAQLTRAQILVQAGTAVLSQANIAPQSALSLLG
ncbi:hypothetical protein COW36_14015 [bacterium (Candidatus Blackallbacteria) CG17_big_fil_post_rev_8_21_14_2_50_48_46]|uniref:Flagellin n=1 Tax=bacterium (Candidatus Blackallbacteria) CG17_big_fil_post_rev_8_21_14_2_50_48_46 TaxID=2014261 RepID=A0A2M7G415_9BACT|nr:MAG: hypothetical protein COW64_23485 [bacterium (Candidatus Blackallbacteria) CG18_big_fil_WC_8_21_14_2_50_49_26]PIW16240.1 MAG: hypothetical protein COW36_14015 [bacterium (Candidatus Blackallbacteria) CG17_big_fil_post_rev_8_21_14_2_50_48_46]PIW49879.1 MAG: hypothetical protein COW20_04290 [bacterium (Candidatus Blackallbacteria) CG13_big_fil_rev_8_21_14_2_50_49_14]